MLVIIGTAMLPFTGEDAHAMGEAHHHETTMTQQALASHTATGRTNEDGKADHLSHAQVSHAQVSHAQASHAQSTHAQASHHQPSRSQSGVADNCCGICVADVTVPTALFTYHHPFTPIDGPAFSVAPNFPDLPSPPPRQSA
jgi:hypothetical protein